MFRNRHFLPVYLPTLLLAFGQGMLIPTFPFYAESFGVPFSLVGLAVAALSLGTLLADIPTGFLLDRLGKKRMMLLGTASLALASLALALATYFPEVIVYRLISGVSAAMWNISRLAYLTSMTDARERGRSIAAFGGIARIGTFGGPVVGGIVATQFGLTAPFLLQAALAALATVLSAAFIAEPSQDRDQMPARPHHKDLSLIGTLLRRHYKDFMTAGSAQVFAQMIRQGRQIIVPLYGAYVIGLDVAQVGTIVSISAMIDMSLFYPAGVIMDRFGRKYASVPSFLIMGLGMALIPIATGYWGLLAATAIIGLGNGLGSGTMMTLGADLAPKDAVGPYLGIWRLIGDAGSAGGPMLVGTIADVLGLYFAAFSLAGIGIVAASILTAFVAETRAVPEARAVRTST